MALVASVAQWVEGARPRTLPNAIAPVIAGTGAAAWLHGAVWWKALLALIVAVAMIVGVNYANDYSDGIRGTDDVRAGPLRLVGSRLATPRSVLVAAAVSFGIAAAAGVVLAVVSAPWLIVVGADHDQPRRADHGQHHPAAAATPKLTTAAVRTERGVANRDPTSRSGPARTSSVPRMPSE